MMESYKFHYLCNFQHFRRIYTTKTILLLYYVLARGHFIDFINRQNARVSSQIYLCIKFTSWINKWDSVKYSVEIIKSIEFNITYSYERFCGV